MSKPFTVEDGQRRIRSFVLRQGRLTPAQESALERLWPRYGLDYCGEPRDFDAEFGHHAERVLEIGFGNGDALLQACQAEVARDFLGVEVHRPGVGRLLREADVAGVGNLRVYCHDAVEVLSREVPDAALDEVRIYFPDPWHKARHNKRRLIQPGFIDLLCSRLKPGGMLHLATDWQHYAEHMWDVLDAEPRLRNRAGARGFVARPPWRPQTHFESRGQKLGHGVWDLIYDRIDD